MIMEKEYETIIGKILIKYVPIEWMKFTMFNISDVYLSIPMLVFRLKQKDDKFDELIKCIGDFNGNARWEIFRSPYARKENYILTVSEIKLMYQENKENLSSQKDFFGERYTEICDRALSDIPELADHIEKWFEE